MKALFIMPHYSSDDEFSVKNLTESITSIINQSVSDWHLIIIDDLSPDRTSIEYLKQIESTHSSNITVVYNSHNIGPGGCRNIGIKFGYENLYDLVFYIDADDVCHPDRLKTCRDIFLANPNVDVVYSTFSVIDEYSSPVNTDSLCGAIKEILESHCYPPEGPNAWIDIAIRTGYTNLTSATAVRTNIAYQFPFPLFRVSEDMHTWLRYSAGGGDFKFCPAELTKYRIPQNTKGSASRSREGGENSFYSTKAEVDEEGFKLAYLEAIKLGKVDESSSMNLFAMFHQKLAVTMIKASQYELAIAQLKKSLHICEQSFLIQA